MDFALTIANSAAVVLLVAFVVIYHARAPWWATSYGRSIVAMKLGVLFVAVGGLARCADRQDLADVVILLGWIAVALVMACRTRMLWRDTSRRRDRDDAS